MPLDVYCPSGCLIRMSSNKVGRIVRCPKCKSPIRIPNVPMESFESGKHVPVQARFAVRRSAAEPLSDVVAESTVPETSAVEQTGSAPSPTDVSSIRSSVEPDSSSDAEQENSQGVPKDVPQGRLPVPDLVKPKLKVRRQPLDPEESSRLQEFDAIPATPELGSMQIRAAVPGVDSEACDEIAAPPEAGEFQLDSAHGDSTQSEVVPGEIPPVDSESTERDAALDSLFADEQPSRDPVIPVEGSETKSESGSLETSPTESNATETESSVEEAPALLAQSVLDFESSAKNETPTDQLDASAASVEEPAEIKREPQPKKRRNKKRRKNRHGKNSAAPQESPANETQPAPPETAQSHDQPLRDSPVENPSAEPVFGGPEGQLGESIESVEPTETQSNSQVVADSHLETVPLINKGEPNADVPVELDREFDADQSEDSWGEEKRLDFPGINDPGTPSTPVLEGTNESQFAFQPTAGVSLESIPVISLDEGVTEKQAATPEVNWEERLENANADRRFLARFFAICLCFVAIVNMTPALYHWYHWSQLAESMALPRWIYIQVFVGLIHLVYAVFLFQINDWSAMRSVSIAMLVVAFVFGVVSTGLLVGGGQGELTGFLGIPYALNREASIWCVAMLCLATLMSYWGGKESSNWQRADSLLKDILSKPTV